jgi:hypothetical protein
VLVAQPVGQGVGDLALAARRQPAHHECLLVGFQRSAPSY